MDTTAKTPQNRLATEQSLYLRQHAHNAVDWYPWGEEAFAAARARDLPILLSIGYSACHWCHVMERESFSDAEVAAYQNAHFVNVKVDREEHPALDRLYLNVCQLLTRSGGWPLHAFLLPDGQAFHATTYHPPVARRGRAAWRELLEALVEAWTERRDEVVETAADITEALRQHEGRGHDPQAPLDVSADLQVVRDAIRARFDVQLGGFGEAPKFPSAPALAWLARLAHDGQPQEPAHLMRTLLAMACGGLYDQLAGGFFRYSTDGRWIVPHFEKMCVDQGLLLAEYAHALRFCDDEAHAAHVREVLAQTVAWLAADLQLADGGFAAALAAEVAGEEGVPYVWTPGEIAEVLGDAGADACGLFGVQAVGSFDGRERSVLQRLQTDATLATQLNVSVDEATTRRGTWTTRLLAARARRPQPVRDDKLVRSWNALTVSGLVRAWLATGDPSAYALAVQGGERLLGPPALAGRTWYAGAGWCGAATLEDQAASLQAAVDLFVLSSDARWLAWALALAEDLQTRFWDEESAAFGLVAHDQPALVVSLHSAMDDALPSPAGLAILGLLRVAALTGRQDLEDLAGRALARQAGPLRSYPAAMATIARAVWLQARGVFVHVGVVPASTSAADAEVLRRDAWAQAAPDDVLVMVWEAAPSQFSPPRQHDADAAPPVVPAADTALLDPDLLQGRIAQQGRATWYVCGPDGCQQPRIV